MREILFRGKRKDTGEWVQGDLIHSQYKLGDTCVGQYGNTVGIHQVDPETVGQFTGLPDKNGKKIFDGDILSNANVKGVVFYSDKSACFMLRWKKFYENKFREDFFKECRFTDFARFEYMEVIGTIHDNPELLNEERRPK